jgi:hypothetical protein
MVQPIRALSFETGGPVSTFFMKLIMEDEHIYVQLEGFSSKEFEETIIENFPNHDRWSVVQPGILRLKILE